MTFSTKFNTSCELLRRSLHVLRRNPKLLLLPVVSMFCTLVLALFFLAPLVAMFVDQEWMTLQHWSAVGENLENFSAQDLAPLGENLSGAFYAYVAGVYLVSLVAATFFNVAFYAEILRALAGLPVSVGGGLRFARRRLPAILLWSVLAGTVGLAIRAVENRLGWLGKVVTGLVGTTWSVAAVFAIPAIIRSRGTNPFGTLRDSAAMLRRTWGESVGGFVTTQLGGVLAMLIAGVLGGIGAAVAVKLHLPWIALSIVAMSVAAMIGVGCLANLAMHVYRCALYVYASEGVVPGPYAAEMMDAAWKVKKA